MAGSNAEPNLQEDWLSQQLQTLARQGVFGWIIPRQFGGQELREDEALEALIELGQQNLTTAFVLTQFQAAVHRILLSPNLALPARWLPRLATGELFTTVGLSHLTTSRSRGPGPAVLAVPLAQGGYRISGKIPWVTGGRLAGVILVGAVTDRGDQFLALIEREAPGVTVAPALNLLALTESSTGPIGLEAVEVSPDQIVAGPAPDVMKGGNTAGTGSLTTSALALSAGLHSLAGLRALAGTGELLPVVDRLAHTATNLRSRLLSASRRESSTDSAEDLRFLTNSFAVRTAQLWLSAAKGTGFVSGHPAEKAVRESMFFYVWSCPQAVVTRHWQALADDEHLP